MLRLVVILRQYMHACVCVCVNCLDRAFEESMHPDEPNGYNSWQRHHVLSIGHVRSYSDGLPNLKAADAGVPQGPTQRMARVSFAGNSLQLMGSLASTSPEYSTIWSTRPYSKTYLTLLTLPCRFMTSVSEKTTSAFALSRFP